jgi:dipeptidase D
MNIGGRATVFCIIFANLAIAGCQSAQSGMTLKDNCMTTTKIALKDAQAQRVWEIFKQINRIPRCSKEERQIIEWLKNYAQSRKLACRNDAVGNLVIELPASKDYEKSPAVVLQSHVDMVCEKTPESKHDFSKDPIEFIERDGWVCADGTTLGADNGIGVSLALALSEVEGQAHPKVELLFTVDEETGLTGANALQQGFITGKYFINLDGEDESFVVGCAGGEQTEISLRFYRTDALSGYDSYILKVSGLHGGHSGVDIDKNYANAIKLLAKALSAIQNQVDMHICSIDGGKAANAIPRDAKAVILIKPSNIDAAHKTITDLESSFKKEFYATEPNLTVKLDKTTIIAEQKIINHKSKIINLLSAIPTGVYRMSDEFEGTVETSNNLASIETSDSNNLIRITTMQRGFDMQSMTELTDKITDLAEQAGAEVKITNRYPAWKPDTDSLLLVRAQEVYKKLYCKELPAKVVHAGLEPAVIGDKFHGIEMISAGPTIENPHSPLERVNIASVDNAWEFLLALLRSLK